MSYPDIKMASLLLLPTLFLIFFSPLHKQTFITLKDMCERIAESSRAFALFLHGICVHFGLDMSFILTQGQNNEGSTGLFLLI